MGGYALPTWGTLDETGWLDQLVALMLVGFLTGREVRVPNRGWLFVLFSLAFRRILLFKVEGIANIVGPRCVSHLWGSMLIRAILLSK